MITVQAEIREPRGFPHVGDLGRGLDHPQPAHEIGGLHQFAKPIERCLHTLQVVAREAVGVGLYPQSLSPTTVLFEDLPQVPGGICALCVIPDPDILYHRRMPGLAHVRGAGQEGEGLAIGAHVEALEEDVAERVVPRQVVHRLLAEHEQPVEAAARQLSCGGPTAGCQLFAREMDQVRPRW
jgi:hypothetical protein